MHNFIHNTTEKEILLMKANMKLCSIVLSAGIIASSILPAFAAQSTESYIPKVSSNNYESGFISGKLTEKSKESPEKIVEKNYNKVFLPSAGKMLVKQSKEDKQFKKDEQFKNSKGRTVVKTTQTYNGVPIFGTEQNFHINDEGIIECIVGSTVGDMENKLASSASNIQTSKQDALSAVENHLGFKPEYVENPEFELVLYPVKDKYTYSYKVSISFDKPSFGRYTYIVDAKSLSILDVFNEVASAEQPAVGSGIGQFGTVKQNLKMVYSDTGTYYLDNTVEKIWTRNYATSTRYSEPDSFFDSGTPSNFQQDAVDAHYYMSNVLKFFKDTFGRNGNDDAGSKYNLYINENNTGWNAYGGKNYGEFLVGHGAAGRSMACCIDVIGHEFTHGMLFSEGLSYSYPQSSSLHEGLADIFGTICEYFIPNDGSFDWTNAEDSGTITRDSANPLIDDYGDFLAQNAQAHGGGGVVTKAAYLIAEGGTHNNKSVTGIGYTKLANVFYNAINDGYIVSNMTFLQFADAAVHAAELEYGTGSQEVQTVKDAFSAVGVLGGDIPENFTMTGRNGLSVQFSWNGTPGEKYAIYKSNGQTLVKLTVTTGLTGTANTQYGSWDFYVAKVDSNGNRISGFSNAVNVAVYSEAPQNFRITGRNGLNVTFSWDGTSVNGYLIYRRTSGSSGEGELIDWTNNTSYGANIVPGSYDYYVAECGSLLNRVSEFSNTVTLVGAEAPQNLAIIQQSLSVVRLSWNGTSGTRYALYRKVTGSTDAPAKVLETTNTWCLTSVNGSYDFYVAQVDSNGDRISAFSNSVTAQYY
jgi:Zn-dependent metalloprotease